MTRCEIEAEARRWLDVPYRRMGRSAKGVDCLGLLVLIGRHFEVPHEDLAAYSEWPDPDRLIITTFDRFLIKADPAHLRRGTVGVFAESRLPCHAGLFSWCHNRLHLIHARIDMKKVVEQEWRPHENELRLIRAYDLPGVED